MSFLIGRFSVFLTIYARRTTPPALRATSPISAHRRAEEEVVVKASSFTKVRENGTTCHTLQYCGISLSTKDSRPYILFTSIEFYQTAIEKF